MMTYQHVRVGLVAIMLVLAGPALAGPALAGPALAGPLDPDCSVAKAARGAATKAVVGVKSNRCDAGETARDTLGIDDQDRNKIGDRDRKNKNGDGVLNKVRKN